MAATWKQNFNRLLTQHFGEKKAGIYEDKYAFPAGYTDECPAKIAVIDIEEIETLSADVPLKIYLYYDKESPEYPLHIRLYQWGKLIPLSDILPILENFNLRTDNEQPYKIILNHQQTVFISDFAVRSTNPDLEIKNVEAIFQDAFIKIYFEQAENDGFNKLILGALLTWREVSILRTYAKYLRQIGFRFSQVYIEKALSEHVDISRCLVEFFLDMHDPHKKTKTFHKIEERILQALESVTSLDEDRIIRTILALMKGTLRTNYFQTKSDGNPKEYLSVKLNSRHIPNLPLPLPLYEIFVYSPRFEAIHLRYTKVARGGIRWSDRHEDFRTEILGLMKAQVVKNAVIVPSGAKGGFVLKSLKSFTTREALQAEVIYCYKAFISGLLDLTDNIKDKKIIHPKNVVCYDDDDTYLVVAADKGTATFSDIANSISQEYNFWLGDAFASGGSTGYDHKKMGITARGAWESIKRHFRELNVDIYQHDISVIGIGDMSGDVFGNGMLYTKHIKLVAAFDHRDIFIDPDPDPSVSYEERLRLFNLPNSSWQDYNPKLISKGGGVFKRSVKSIALTPQMRQVLGTDAHALDPTDLIRVILKAPVDLLYNGGIGTYVKASFQTQEEVGDRTNDYCRVNGNELHCKVVGEGGNLGFTQEGRIEYALIGGLINTDFIDNSGGVDCSDHEVNLKILLDKDVRAGALTEKKRNVTLASVTDEVAALVLQDNYHQALVMSTTAFHAKKNISLHTNYIKELETQNLLDRNVEYLPSDKELVERKAAGLGLTRPELAVLLAYTKINIKHALLKTALPEDDYLKDVVETAFPISLRKKYFPEMLDHPLHRDIIATQLSNQIVNEMGITFVYRFQTETGAAVDEIIKSYAVASHIFGAHEIQELIESLDFKIPMPEQYEMLFNIRNLINLATRWFLQNGRLKGNLRDIIDHYSIRIKTLENLTPVLMGGFTREYLNTLTERFIKIGLPKEIARRIATYRAIYASLNIIDVATRNHFDLEKTAKIYFAAGEKINLVWFRDYLSKDSRDGHWNILSRLTLRDELDIAQRALTVAIIKTDKKEKNADVLINKWMEKNQRALTRWDKILSMLHSSSEIEYPMFFIAVRELLGLIVTPETSTL